MPDIVECWRAGRTRRWHMNADLSRTEDYDDGHGGRVALIAIILRPELSLEGLLYALVHDHAEDQVGDVARPVKENNPGLRERLECEERLVLRRRGLPAGAPEEDMGAIHVADRLDAILWANHHNPSLFTRAEWQADVCGVLDLAQSSLLSREAVVMVREILQPLLMSDDNSPHVGS